MAREINEIFEEVTAAFIASPIVQQVYGLNPLNTFAQEFSKVSIESILFYTVATAIFTLEKLFDVHKAWVETRAKELKGGSLPWYVARSKEFQYGDALTFNDEKYEYPVVNEVNKLVKLASATEVGNQVLLKVANINTSGDVEKLTTPQLDSFKAYMKKVKYAGVKVLSVSRDPDTLMIHYHVYVDALVMASDGSLISDPSIFPVEDAINEYVKTLDFNGVFSVTALTDKIQSKAGVLNPVFESAQAKYGTNPYASFVDYYTSNAGYLEVDQANPLNTTITYILQ